MYTTFTAKGTQYKLRFTVNSMCEIERVAGKPMSKLMGDGENIGVKELRLLFWGGLLPLNHGITEAKAGEIMDNYTSEGKTFADLSNLITDAMKASGLIGEQQGEVLGTA